MFLLSHDGNSPSTDVFTVCIVFPFPGCHVLRPIQHVACASEILSLRNMHLRFLCVCLTSQLVSFWPRTISRRPGAPWLSYAATCYSTPSSPPGFGHHGYKRMLFEEVSLHSFLSRKDGCKNEKQVELERCRHRGGGEEELGCWGR